MEGYMPSYVSVIPRLTPAQAGTKKIPMAEEQYRYPDSSPPIPYSSPTMMMNRSANFTPLATRTQLGNNEMPQHESPYGNRPFIPHTFENSLNGRLPGRYHFEPLKDNSGDPFPRNAYPVYTYAPNYEMGSYDNLKRFPNQNNQKPFPVTFFIVAAIIIGLFSITALGISIYLLVRISTS